MAERFGDADGFALATHAQGAHADQGGTCAGGARSPRRGDARGDGEASSRRSTTGIVYCGVILACQEVYEVRRAREWTAALTRWCEGQPDVRGVHGPMPRPPRRDPAAERRLAGRARGGAEGEAALHRRRGTKVASAWRCTGKPSFSGSSESSRMRRTPTARRAATAGTRSPASLSYGSRRVESTPLVSSIRARARRDRRSRSSAWDCSQRYVEIMLAAGDIEAAGRACSRARAAGRAIRERDARRHGRATREEP